MCVCVCDVLFNDRISFERGIIRCLSLHKHHRVYGDAARDYMFSLLFFSMSSVSQVAHWNGYYDVHGCHVSLSHQLDTA